MARRSGHTVTVVRTSLTRDEVEDLYARARTPKQHRAAAEKLTAWAEESHPDDQDVSPAALLVSAGEHLTEAGDLEGAVALFRRAVAAGEHVPPDVRCYLHGGLLRVGDAEAARQIAEELRRERPVDGDVYLFLGENHELADDLREAHRWLTKGARRAFNEVEDGDDARQRMRQVCSWRGCACATPSTSRSTSTTRSSRRRCSTSPTPRTDRRPAARSGMGA